MKTPIVIAMFLATACLVAHSHEPARNASLQDCATLLAQAVSGNVVK